MRGPNYAENQSQCFVRLALPGLEGRSVSFEDALSAATYVRDGNELLTHGLYLDMPPWGYHVFRMSH